MSKTSPSKSMRLDRLLVSLGYGGRKEMAMAIKNEWLEIDGERITDPSLRIALDMVAEGRVTFDGEALDTLPPFTIMFNKPAGYSCAHKNDGDLIYDLLPARWRERKPSFSSVGRLDKYSTGQLLMTDNGEFLHRVTTPKTVVPKHYAVTLRDDLRGDEAALFAAGDFMLKDDDKPLKPATWTADGAREGTMILSEGRYRQIRRMFDALGNEVVALHRFQTGGLALGDLAEGEYRVLTDDDINQLFVGAS